MIGINKDHWYDGWFYDKIIAPNQDRLFAVIKELIDADSKIIDVGCGTGRFSFSVNDKCKSVLGLDLIQEEYRPCKPDTFREPERKNFFSA